MKGHLEPETPASVRQSAENGKAVAITLGQLFEALGHPEAIHLFWDNDESLVERGALSPMPAKSGRAPR